MTLDLLTLSCLKKHNIFNSRKTLLQETKFWKTLGIFLSATLFPSRGSVTDLQNKRVRRSHTTLKQFLYIRKDCFRVLILLSLGAESKQSKDTEPRKEALSQGQHGLGCSLDSEQCGQSLVTAQMDTWAGLVAGHRYIRAHTVSTTSTHCSSKADQHLKQRSGWDGKHLHLPQKTLVRVTHVLSYTALILFALLPSSSSPQREKNNNIPFWQNTGKSKATTCPLSAAL